MLISFQQKCNLNKFKIIHMLNRILKGKDRRSQTKLDELIFNIGENPNILWYPSAGDDFRDIIEAETRTEISPDLYFHTDYSKNVAIISGTIFNDGATQVEIMDISFLTSTDEINYYINPDFIDLPENVNSKPSILLLDVLVTYSGGQIRKPVLYWYFENVNFLDEVLLKFDIPVSHLVKVREGMAWGGNRKSISIGYAFLSRLKTRYLLIDNRVDVDFEVLNSIREKHQPNLKNFKLINVAQRRNIADWSGLNVTVMGVEILDDEHCDEKFTANLDIIRSL